MSKIKTFNLFKINESDSSVKCKASSLKGEVELFRLSKSEVVNLSEPGEYYFSDIKNIDPKLIKANNNTQLYLITVKCDSSNIDISKSEKECASQNCDCIVAVVDDKKCKVVTIKPFDK